MSGCVALLAFAGLCGLQDPDELKRLREELEKTKLENIQLKLQVLTDPAQQLALIRDDALRSPFAKVALFGLEYAAKAPPERFAELVAAVAVLAQNGSPPLAARAVDVLAQFAKQERAQAAIRDAANHPDALVRRQVASALRTVASPAALETLSKLAADASEEVRRAAVVAAADHGAAAADLLLDRLAREPDAGALEKIIDGLGTLRQARSADRLIERLSDARENIVWASINALGKIGDARAHGPLLPFLEPGRPEHIRLVAVQSVGRLNLPEGRERLIVMLRADANPKVRRACATALAAAGAPEPAAGPLLEALLSEPEETVREAIWKSMVDLTEGSIDARLALLKALLDRRRAPEAALLCARLHGATLAEAQRAAYAPLERALADALAAADSHREALAHYRNVAPSAPPEAALAQRVLESCRKLADLDAAVAFLRDEFKRAKTDTPDRWSIGDLLAGLVIQRADPYERTQVFYLLLHPNPALPPEETRKRWKAAYDEAAVAVRAALNTPEGQRKAVELGRAIILPLADWLEAEGGAELYLPVLKAGNAVAATRFEEAVLADPKQRAETAKAWRAWHDAPR
jgi:HEAT repeat protein